MSQEGQAREECIHSTSCTELLPHGSLVTDTESEALPCFLSLLTEELSTLFSTLYPPGKTLSWTVCEASVCDPQVLGPETKTTGFKKPNPSFAEANDSGQTSKPGNGTEVNFPISKEQQLSNQCWKLRVGGP